MSKEFSVLRVILEKSFFLNEFKKSTLSLTNKEFQGILSLTVGFLLRYF